MFLSLSSSCVSNRCHFSCLILILSYFSHLSLIYIVEIASEFLRFRCSTETASVWFPCVTFKSNTLYVLSEVVLPLRYRTWHLICIIWMGERMIWQFSMYWSMIFPNLSLNSFEVFGELTGLEIVRGDCCQFCSLVWSLHTCVCVTNINGQSCHQFIF